MNKINAIALLAVAAIAHASDPHASLAEQKMCAAQAESVFNAWKSDVAPTLGSNGIITEQDYVNHYDARAHVCYVMTHSVTLDKDKLIYEEYILTDAFEKTEYAEFRVDESGVRTNYVVTPTGALQPTSAVEFLRAVRRTYGVFR
jgi:hypothetical protein